MSLSTDPDPFRGFAGSAVMVTGASSGIGRAVAVSLARAGCGRVGIHYRSNRAGAEKTAAEVASFGVKTSLFAADLATSEHRSALVAEVYQSMGELDSWIQIAGGDVLTGAAGKWSFEAKLEYLWQVDVAASIAIGREVSERMRSSSTGSARPRSLVFIGWDQAPLGMEGDAGQMFGPIKAAVMAFANSLAQAVAPEVRVNTVAPGWIQTAWGAATDAYWDSRARGQALMDRWGTPEDVAAAVLYAANPDHSFLTGQTLDVNGGWNRRFGQMPLRRPPVDP